jgi:hypothetical protein
MDAFCHDIMSDGGYAFALSLILRMTPGGLVWFGIVCSTWVWMCRNSTGRGELWWHGNQAACVQNGNAMVSRVCLLYRIFILLENRMMGCRD